MKELLFPDLYCPFPSQINKHADVLEEYSLEWVLSFNLLDNESAYQHYCKAKFFLLAAATYPNCQLEELKIASDWLSWMMTWDDLCENSTLGKQPEVLKVLHSRFIEILNGAEITSEDTSRGHALSNLRQRILQRGGKQWLPYFVRSVEDYLNGCVQEAVNLRKGSIPDMETCISIRQSSVAAYTFLELIEFCDRLTLTSLVRNEYVFQKIKLLTNNILTWCNDIFSAPKEIADGDFHNVVLVMHYQQEMSLEQAINCATKMHDEELKTLLSLSASIPSFGNKEDSEIEKYISGLYAWIRGNLDWSSRTGRYHALESLELVKI